jgi:pyruvate,orthophosphate dikinase
VTQYVFFFGGGKADGNKDMKDTLGGKGAGLAEMTNAGVPVPPGFTISTRACTAYYDSGRKLPGEVDQQMDAALARLEGLVGKKLGDASDPLLVSVRSGSKFSMPGMMDTILNLGMNDRSVEGLKAKTGNARFAKDSYRRFIQMYGNVVLGIEKDKFEHELSAIKAKYKAKTDVELGEKALDEVIARYKQVVEKDQHHPFPQDPREQLAQWVRPSANGEIRRDLAKFLRTIDPADTYAAAGALKGSDQPKLSLCIVGPGKFRLRVDMPVPDFAHSCMNQKCRCGSLVNKHFI